MPRKSKRSENHLVTVVAIFAIVFLAMCGMYYLSSMNTNQNLMKQQLMKTNVDKPNLSGKAVRSGSTAVVVPADTVVRPVAPAVVGPVPVVRDRSVDRRIDRRVDRRW